MIEYDWLIVDDITFTLEICFDHQMRTALNTYLGDMVTGRHTLIPRSSSSSLTSSSEGQLTYTQIPVHQAQVSLVSSAGMTINPDALALVDRGVIFLQDGLSNAPQRNKLSNRLVRQNNTTDSDVNSTLQQEDGSLEMIGGTEGLVRTVHLTPTDVSLAYELLPSPQSVALDKTLLKGVFSQHVYNPAVRIFAPVPLATATEVGKNFARGQG